MKGIKWDGIVEQWLLSISRRAAVVHAEAPAKREDEESEFKIRGSARKKTRGRKILRFYLSWNAPRTLSLRKYNHNSRKHAESCCCCSATELQSKEHSCFRFTFRLLNEMRRVERCGNSSTSSSRFSFANLGPYIVYRDSSAITISYTDAILRELCNEISCCTSCTTEDEEIY